MAKKLDAVAKKQKTTGSEGPVTQPPGAAKVQSTATADAKFYRDGVELGRVHVLDSEGVPVTKNMSVSEFSKWVDEMRAVDPKGADEFIATNKLKKAEDGSWVQIAPGAAAALNQVLPGKAADNSIGSKVVSGLQKNTWMLPVAGFATGGIGGLVMGLMGAKALKATAGTNALAPGLTGMSAAYSTNQLGTFGTIASALGVVTGNDGMAYQMKKQLTSLAQESKMDSLISMCNNPGMPIEDLIAMFMAQMSDTYEQKLRQKMEETARAEKREQERTREKDAGDMKAGLVSSIGSLAAIVPGWGTAIAAGSQAVSSFMRQSTDAKLAIADAAGGYTKSSTILMQEIQILMNKWKQTTELLSNLSKSLHDMAMTPIRNLR